MSLGKDKACHIGSGGMFHRLCNEMRMEAPVRCVKSYK